MKEFVPNDHYCQFSVKRLGLDQSYIPSQAKASDCSSWPLSASHYRILLIFRPSLTVWDIFEGSPRRDSAPISFLTKTWHPDEAMYNFLQEKSSVFLSIINRQITFLWQAVYFFNGMFLLQVISKFHFKSETTLFMQNGRIWSFRQFVFRNFVIL